MSTNRATIALIGGLPLLLSLAACNQADPVVPMDTDTEGMGTTEDVEDTGPVGDSTGEDTSDTEDSDDTAESSGGMDGDPDFYPLVDGATWTYRHTTSTLEVWDEVVMMQEVEWEGATAFEAADNPGGNGESTTAILVRDGTAVLRVHKDVDLAGVPVLSADYDPGFLRYDNAWAEGDSVVWVYDRTEYDSTGTLVETVPRTQIFTIEKESVEVTVPAGTFDCVQFVRERLETGELKRFWFADGVGKVKHETLGSGATEELIEYSIP